MHVGPLPNPSELPPSVSFPEVVSRETHDRLARHVELVRAWNARINLVSKSTIGDIWDRHVRDSLQLLRWMTGETEPFADLGSGAGFPGLVLAVASGRPAHLIEADQRKVAFLREAVRHTGAQACVHALRAETVPVRVRLITARALAPLRLLLDLAEPMLLPGATCLFLKGGNLRSELEEACLGWKMNIQCVPSVTSPGSAVLVVTDASRRRSTSPGEMSA
ncbi:MAG: 16S rRNA (guanine(527)-N(7))-methyltransferase RsmG [Acidisphaera sp.]|nr:16S rRNA (guanine(527)-N(7))-methyltransferase RsmG [Acidisphaera sp.]